MDVFLPKRVILSKKRKKPYGLTNYRLGHFYATITSLVVHARAKKGYIAVLVPTELASVS